jgi:hypothetical protein
MMSLPRAQNSWKHIKAVIAAPGIELDEKIVFELMERGGEGNGLHIQFIGHGIYRGREGIKPRCLIARFEDDDGEPYGYILEDDPKHKKRGETNAQISVYITDPNAYDRHLCREEVRKHIDQQLEVIKAKENTLKQDEPKKPLKPIKSELHKGQECTFSEEQEFALSAPHHVHLEEDQGQEKPSSC